MAHRGVNPPLSFWMKSHHVAIGKIQVSPRIFVGSVLPCFKADEMIIASERLEGHGQHEHGGRTAGIRPIFEELIDAVRNTSAPLSTTTSESANKNTSRKTSDLGARQIGYQKLK